jgi:hypothetical protein
MLLWLFELRHFILNEQTPFDPSQKSSAKGSPQEGDLVIRVTPPSWGRPAFSVLVHDPRARVAAFVMLVLGVVLIANHGWHDTSPQTQSDAATEPADVPGQVDSHGHISDLAPEAPHTPEGDVYRKCLTDQLVHHDLNCSGYLSSRAQVQVPETHYIALHAHAPAPGVDFPALLAFHGQNVQIVSVPSANQIPLSCAPPACHRMTGDVDVLFGDIGEHDRLDLKIGADHGDVQTAVVHASDGHAVRGPPSSGTASSEPALHAVTELTVVYIVGRIGNIVGPPHLRGESRMSAQLEDFGQTLEGVKSKVNERPGWTDLLVKNEELRLREGIERKGSNTDRDGEGKPLEQEPKPVIHPEPVIP